nr:hypothetical protein [Tanacetum cinerariifolium]
EISVITILYDLRSQLAGHLKVNKEQSLANDFLKVELERYKTQTGAGYDQGTSYDFDINLEVQSYRNHFFDNVNPQASQEMHQEE